MKYRLTILPQAKKDVRRNAEWWAHHHSSEPAARWLNAVQSQLATIVNLPESYSLSAETDNFFTKIRDKLVGFGLHPGYRAVFTIKVDKVFVLTVRRATQDTLRPDQFDSLPSP